MAFPRYFFALCAILVFVVVIGIHAEVDSESVEVSSAELEELKNYLAEEYGESAQARGPILAKIIRILRKLLKTAAIRCVREAVNQCKDEWRNPKAFLACARAYLRQNEGKCITG